MANDRVTLIHEWFEQVWNLGDSTAIFDLDVASARTDANAGGQSDEGVAAEALAADHRLEQEAVLAAAEGRVGRHRRVAIGEQLAIDRDEIPARGCGDELLPARRVHAPRYSPSPAATGSR